MILLTSRRMIDCIDDEEIEKHSQEISDIFIKLLDLEDYDCAVLCKYQDIGHVNRQMKIRSINLHDIEEIYQWGDLKNGADLFTDDNYEFFYLVTYGQSYQYINEWHEVIEAFKVMPFNEDRDFLNVVEHALHGDEVKVIKEIDDSIQIA